MDEIPEHSFKCGELPPKEHIESLVEASMKLGELYREIKPEIIYAPLRGAYPLLRLMALSAKLDRIEIFFPATTSFIYLASNNRTLWGHDFNIMMLKTLMKYNAINGKIIYIDEIVSGGMINAHTRHMVGDIDKKKKKRGQGIILPKIQNKEAELHVIGVADAKGKRMTPGNRRAMEKREKAGLIKFYIVPTEHLCTEDNVPLLGIHYMGRENGPRVISAKYIKGFWEAYRRFWITIEENLISN